jgi:gas vesicle protein
MRFTLGLVTGAALGLAGAVAYSVWSGRDLREVYADVRTSLEKGDLGTRLAEAQAGIGERIGEAHAEATSATGGAAESVGEHVEKAAEAVQEGVERSGDGAGE